MAKKAAAVAVAEPAAPPPLQPPSKMDAVREAIREGMDKPQDGVAYIKEKYGLEIKPAMFSAYKTSMKVKSSGGKKTATKKTTTTTTDNGISVDMVKGVKELVDRFGASAVREMVSVFED